MSPVTTFKFILLLLVAILGLELVAKRLRLPPAAALLAGGIGIAFLPGVPAINLDPGLVLIVFLPPLLMDGAFFTVWEDFKSNLGSILWLAIGAVIFTTLAVGLVAHWVMPALPWAACFALGAVVSPPDAIAAKAVLGQVALPRRLLVLLEGESLLNDAAGLVLFRFAVAAALTGGFSFRDATLTFVALAVGGVAVGIAIGFLLVKFLRLLDNAYLVITASFLSPWASYIAAETLHVSGVIATVACGIVFGWYQHDIFSASVRMRARAFWEVMIFLLEALVFILIGLSLRGIGLRLGGAGNALLTLAPPVLAVIGAVVLARFIWVFGTDYLSAGVGRLLRRNVAPPSAAAATLMSWAGMRGVVTLAIALSLPETMPGRDLILAAAFAVILVTVLLQGTTIGPLIRLLHLDPSAAAKRGQLSGREAWARMQAVQFAVVESRARAADGTIIHPRLLEQYGYRARILEHFGQAGESLDAHRIAHFDVVLAAVAAGRAELLRLHRSGLIHDDVLRVLERDLDLQEISAEMHRR